MAKIARVQISKEYLEMIIRADFGVYPNRVITTDAPKDLEIVGIDIEGSFYPKTFELYVKSESFEDVPQGAEPPLIKPFVYTVTENNG